MVKYRWITVVICVALLGVVALALPHWWAQVAPAAPTPVAETTVRAARQALAELAVVEPQPLTDYEREFFGPAWADVDANGCDTRNDVLSAWLTDVEADPITACVVHRGRLRDPYTGHLIEFQRGPSTSSAVQIDHVVALADAWRKGAARWSARRALQFANDPANLIPVDGAVNQDKGAEDASTWLPPHEGFHCAYAVQQILVKDAYRLGVSAPELGALGDILTTCDEMSERADTLAGSGERPLAHQTGRARRCSSATGC